MRLFRSSIAVVCIVIPAAAFVGIGCGLFTLPITGPKALITNAHLIHCTVDIMDEDGTPLDGVTVQITKYSMDANLFIGETDKSDTTEQQVNGRYECSSFGNYAVHMSFSKPGFGTVEVLYANADVVHHSGQFIARPAYDEPAINVEKYPQQHVILSRNPEFK
jgi:hypothetical protein